VVVLNKPAGLLVHPIKKFAKEPSLVQWLLKNYPEVAKVGDDPENRPGIVHRLDQDTSGVMIIARTQKAFIHLKRLFQEHQVKKTYVALVWDEIKVPSGVIDRPMGLKSGGLKRTTRIKGTKLIKEARTIYRVRGYYEIPGAKQIFTLVETEPQTGRTHQIRVHLASIGHPVVGDKLYTKRIAPTSIKRQFLHAESLELTLPNGKPAKFSAELPRDLDLKQFSPIDRR
ncbi:MAG: RNA pseudouridine synthase, partial [bacterium]|nr:RNA pseudouridine synthase [bacterium]